MFICNFCHPCRLWARWDAIKIFVLILHAATGRSARDSRSVPVHKSFCVQLQTIRLWEMQLQVGCCHTGYLPAYKNLGFSKLT